MKHCLWAAAAVLLSTGCDGAGNDLNSAWQLVFEGLPGALISVTGTSEHDVWAVGADGGEGTTVLHYDGSVWRHKDTGLTGVDLWWTHAFNENSLMMGGSGGTIVRTDGENFERMPTPGTSTVFGVWGSHENDVWAVGGEVESVGFVWHYDGEAWSDRTAELPEAVRDAVYFKVWGQTADDVWLVGLEGAAVHWNGESFEQGNVDTTRRLLTVHGSPEGEPQFVAVGGFGDAVISEFNGSAWHNVAPAGAFPQLFGVFMSGNGEGYAVGVDGTVVRRSAQGWQEEETEINTAQSLHSVWVDPNGGVWAVGGDLIAPPLFDGILLHKGGVVAGTLD